MKGRLTLEKLKNWINEQFLKLEMFDFEVVSIERTRFTTDQYEGGACKLYVWFECKSLPRTSLMKRSYFLCFYSIKQYQEYINNGYELYFKFKNNRSSILNNLEIEVRKINNTL